MINFLARTAGPFIIAVGIATITGSIAHTIDVLVKLEQMGVDVPAGVWLSTMIEDIVGLSTSTPVSYSAVISVALLLGFSITALVRRVLTVRPVLGYAIGGTCAMAALLTTMTAVLGLTPIAPARAPLGFIIQCLAGGAGGAAFGWIKARIAP